MTILEKLKDVLEAEDLQKLNDYIKTMVEEEVVKRVAIIAEERTTKLDVMAEKFVAQRVAEEKAKLEQENQKALDEMEDRLIGQLDSFLEEEINANISDKALEKVAINETLLPIVTGIKKLFEESHMELDSEGSALLKSMQEQVETLKTEHSKLIAEKMEQSVLIEAAAKDRIISEKINGLTEEQKVRVKTFVESKDFESVQTDIDRIISIVIEEENKVGHAINEEVVNADIVPQGDGIAKVKPTVEKSTSSIAAAAARFM